MIYLAVFLGGAVVGAVGVAVYAMVSVAFEREYPDREVLR